MTNQQLSIDAFKEFRKGNIQKAWEMDKTSGCLNDGVTVCRWLEYNTKRLNGEIEEQKSYKKNYPTFDF